MPRLYDYRNFIGRPLRGVRQPDRRYHDMLREIRCCTSGLESLDDPQLRTSFTELRRSVEGGVALTSTAVVIKTFALANEALRRSRSMVYYDVQLMAGLTLAAGTIAEIQTGEGKTITTALPAILHALSGKGAHVATTNEYLSQRDFDELKPVYQMLGLRVGLLTSKATVHTQRAAYACDITYGPGYEFGFDFLKDQLALRSRPKESLGERFLQSLRNQQFTQQPIMQRGHAVAIIDEADSVLIDEAATPLILSGVDSNKGTCHQAYRLAKAIAQSLIKDEHFHTESTNESIELSPAGSALIHQRFAAGPPMTIARPWTQIIQNALRANHFLHRDVHYVVQDGEVQIVDSNTGRIHQERSWRGGLHQAVEVKEGLQPSPEKATQGRITRQRLLQFYDVVCGLTGTASGSEIELHEFYRLPVIKIPTHLPSQRIDYPARFFATREKKYDAICEDILTRNCSGQPILVGTQTIEDSLYLADLLQRRGLPHTVLNGLQDADEAQVVATAGRLGAVTVATNMAGRGTDISLPSESIAAGGLHVIAAEFHPSARVDRQLAGRAARQGKPGSCQFFASAQDTLFVKYAAKLARRFHRLSESQLAESVARLQSQLDRQGLDSRRNMVANDRWLETVQETLAKRA